MGGQGAASPLAVRPGASCPCWGGPRQGAFWGRWGLCPSPPPLLRSPLHRHKPWKESVSQSVNRPPDQRMQREYAVCVGTCITQPPLTSWTHKRAERALAWLGRFGGLRSHHVETESMQERPWSDMGGAERRVILVREHQMKAPYVRSLVFVAQPRGALPHGETRHGRTCGLMGGGPLLARVGLSGDRASRAPSCSPVNTSVNIRQW